MPSGEAQLIEVIRKQDAVKKLMTLRVLLEVLKTDGSFLKGYFYCFRSNKSMPKM